MAAVESSDGLTDTNTADLRSLARNSSWNLAGSVVAALLNLILPVVVTRRLSSEDAGAFFSVTAIFAILMSFGTLGADTGMLWALPRARALNRRSEVSTTLRLAITPVVICSSIVSAVVFISAPEIAAILGKQTPLQHDTIVSALRILAIALPITSVYVITTSATRGLGAIKPLVYIEKIGRNALQTGLVSFVLLVSPSLMLAVIAWVSPYIGAILIMGGVIRRLLHSTRMDVDAHPAAPRAGRQIGREFWAFSGPRALSKIFAVALQRFDILLVSAVRGLDDAAVYAAASRFLFLGLMFVQAIQIVMAPRISGLLAKQEMRRAQSMYAMTTAWLMLLAWPIYLSSALFAGLLVTVFGPDYARGAPAVSILCCTMLLATACGPVDTVLLMGGRSRWSLLNTGLALTANVAADLLLVPAYGITGAAVGWAVGIVVGNLLPLLQVHRFLGMHPFGSASVRAAVTSLGCFGVWGIVARAALGETVTGCLLAIIAGGLAYVLCLRAQAPLLGLDAVSSVIRGRSRRVRDKESK